MSSPCCPSVEEQEIEMRNNKTCIGSFQTSTGLLLDKGGKYYPGPKKCLRGGSKRASPGSSEEAQDTCPTTTSWSR